MNSVKLGPGRYSMFKVDGAVGDSGFMLKSINPETAEQVGEEGEIVVGCRLMCGSTYARSYHHQDWWLTSIVEEIQSVSDDGKQAVIKTKSGSLYSVSVS